MPEDPDLPEAAQKLYLALLGDPLGSAPDDGNGESAGGTCDSFKALLERNLVMEIPTLKGRSHIGGCP